MKSKIVCKLFSEETWINPYTQRKIKKNGPTYKRLKKACSEELMPCETFQQDTMINPYTNRKIKKNGVTYRKLMNECCNCLKKCKINNK